MPISKSVLESYNPWWFDVPHPIIHDREVLAEVRKYWVSPQMLALTGLRRSGKSTLLLKLGLDAIAAGLSPLSVLYFSFDLHREVSLAELVREYEIAAHRDISRDRCLLLLDEIQKLPGWEDQVKTLYDQNKGRLKIALTGSESLFVRFRSKETLAGRLFEFRVNTLSFREYLSFVGLDPTKGRIREKDLRRHLSGWLRCQGFPELVGHEDQAYVRKYIAETVVERIIFRDLQGMFRVRDIQVLDSLMALLMERPGQILDITSMANDLHVHRRTVSTYLRYLEEAYLLRKLYNYAGNRRKEERKLKKYYPTVIDAELPFRDDGEARGFVLEWAVVRSVGAEHFWRDPQQHEVDVVLEQPRNRRPIPLEVKASVRDLGGMRAFLDRYHPDRAFVVTETEEPDVVLGRTNVTVLPALRFFLDPGQSQLLGNPQASSAEHRAPRFA